MSEPTSLRAGDSVAWSRELPDYPSAAGWALAYRLIPASGAVVQIPTTGAGTTYSVALTSGNTAAWPVGKATLAALVSNAGTGERITLGATPIEILPDLGAATAFDPRSQARKALEQLRAVFAAVSADSNALTSEYQIAGRMRRFRSVEDILAAIRYWEAEVAKEDAAAALMAGGTGRGRIQVRL